MSKKIATPITDQHATDGWSGDAFAVSQKVSERLEKQRAKAIELLYAFVRVKDAAFESWPLYWLVQDEQGGCVFCGRSGPKNLLDQPRLDDHDGDCPLRNAYLFLKRNRK